VAPHITRRQIRRWRAEFPYHWDTDDFVSRRRLLQLAVFTSGALFASTAGIAVLGLLRSATRSTIEPRPVARVTEVRAGEAIYFEYPDPGDQAMLLRLPAGQLVAYGQKCTHLSCSVVYQPERDRLFCPCHEGVFNPQTGDPVAGPPQRRLEQIRLRRDGETIYAVGIEP
jgi:Rieske Fe-S protein